jgi:tetratricopeptide (TPR) repeat protein
MYEKAVEDADKAVELDESNVKAIFRRGTANLKLQNYEAAVRDFEKASHLCSQISSVLDSSCPLLQRSM